jgi:spore coat polysaccharide biosynthesis protein SpsF (cytidylyltransferase family)
MEMEPVTMTARTPLQQLMMEKALAMAEELERAGAAASDGHVLDELEMLAVARGRDFTRGALEGALQRQVDEVEKKLRLAASVDAAKGGVTKGRRRVKS